MQLFSSTTETRHAPPVVPKVVIDPVSVCMGLVYGDPQARRLIDLCREGRCIPLVSDDTLRELCRALSSPFFAHAPLAARKSMLRDFVRIARRLGVRRSVKRPPAGMASVLLAMAGQAQVLITPSPDEVPRAPGMNFRVLSPAAFLSELVPDQLFLQRPPKLH
jgi:predicted nucleic acid-binding protein